MFNFFSRKSANAQAQPATKSLEDSLAETAALRNSQLRTPSPSVTSAIGKNIPNPSPTAHETVQGPPITPSPPPDNLLDKDLGLITDPAALHALVSSVPPKVLHEYTLAHLIPPARSSKPIHPPSSLTLTHLTSFFSSLTPPPQLHCVRCHKFYYDVENVERSCLVPHDDESAEVERVGGKGADTQYETLWNCCGRTVEGDGDMGPPDGWCYEGKHTTDTKRARFRADSTLYDDKLVSCHRLKCFEAHVSDDGSSESSITSSHRPRKRKRSTRKREEKEAAAEQNEDPAAMDDDDDDDARSVTSTRSQSRKKKKLKAAAPPAAPSSPVASASASASISAPVPKPRKKRTKATHDEKAFKPEASASDDDDMDVDDSASVSATKKRAPRGSKAAKVSSSASANEGSGAGAGSAGGKGRVKAAMKPRAKSNNNSVPTVEIVATPGSSPTHGASASSDERRRKLSVSFVDPDVGMDSGSSSKGGKPRSAARPRAKKLEEVVASSVDGEM
ncbi:hypothetical protein GYMLUDRAFT_246408 [Collybiopsis luxurians FD-317 M1]|uniref:C2H2-type domain-containing protein n=1 Tax=Collybiopsis luxurians FD-317 M1 TaxID=944289 RepID=A0A0D0CR83_9AGAR|nr:hypothetical protein GYMLUDRAFT_246408 [Collybiopsis luxurians FD-317 M1]